MSHECASLQECIKWPSHSRSADVFPTKYEHERHEPFPSSVNAAASSDLLEQLASGLNAEVFGRWRSPGFTTC